MEYSIFQNLLKIVVEAKNWNIPYSIKNKKTQLYEKNEIFYIVKFILNYFFWNIENSNFMPPQRFLKNFWKMNIVPQK